MHLVSKDLTIIFFLEKRHLASIKRQSTSL